MNGTQAYTIVRTCTRYQALRAKGVSKYTGIWAEAIAFLEEMKDEIGPLMQEHPAAGEGAHEARRLFAFARLPEPSYYFHPCIR